MQLEVVTCADLNPAKITGLIDFSLLTVEQIAQLCAIIANCPKPAPKLVVSKAVSPAPPFVGVPATYTITVKNDGDAAATNVVVTDPLPANIVYVAGSIAGGDTRSDATPGNLSWSMASLAPGQSMDLTFVAKSSNTTAATNTASATADNAPTASGAASSTAINCPNWAAWTSGNAGTMGGIPVTVAFNTDPAGTPNYWGAPTNVSGRNFAAPAGTYTPSKASTTAITNTSVTGLTGHNCFDITFAQPVTDVQFHLFGLDHDQFTVDLANSPGVTGISKLSRANLILTGTQMTNANPGATSGNVANGTILISGTFTKVRICAQKLNTNSDQMWFTLSDC